MTEQQPTVKQIHVPRAAKACTACRRQKTRCFPSNDSASCLRCQSLSKPCSFATDGTGNGGNNGANGNPRLLPGGQNALVGGIKRTVSEAGLDIDLGALDQNVKSILSILQSKQGFKNMDFVKPNEDIPVTDGSNELTPVSSYKTSPFNFLMNSITDSYIPNSIRSLTNPEKVLLESKRKQENVISLGIISQKDAQLLIDRFKDHYSRWISIPNDITSQEFVENLTENSPLFLTTIVTTALRYHHPGNNSSSQPLRQALKKQLKKELQKIMIQPNLKSIDDLKALVIISVYGYSLTPDNEDDDLDQDLIDPWTISGIAIQKFLSYDIKSQLLNLDQLSSDLSMTLEEENNKLSNFRIWNHIALVHLVNCVFSSRSCLLDEIRLDQTRKSLDLSQATNFDGRMVSEISLQLLLYNYLQSNSHSSSTSLENIADYQSFQQELGQWYEQWSYLFKQPTLQFTEFCYHYVNIVALFHHKFGALGSNPLDLDLKDLEITDPTVLKKLLYHSIKVIDHINNIREGDPFLSLSDQLHISTTFTTLLFLKVIEWSSKHGDFINQFEIVEHISKAKSIKEKFETYSIMPQDLLGKFSKGIQESIEALLSRV